MIRIICRSALWTMTFFYTFISFTVVTILLPLFIIIIFSEKDGSWGKVFKFWKEGAFVGIHIMREQ